MDEEIIFDGDITDNVIRKWAYDENMWLCEQDEDLLLGSREYFPVLFVHNGSSRLFYNQEFLRIATLRWHLQK